MLTFRQRYQCLICCRRELEQSLDVLRAWSVESLVMTVERGHPDLCDADRPLDRSHHRTLRPGHRPENRACRLAGLRRGGGGLCATAWPLRASTSGNVETLLRGFQLAPGEVGLVDAVFELVKAGYHGFITHKRCPSKDRFGEIQPRAPGEQLRALCHRHAQIRRAGQREHIRCRPVDISSPYRGDARAHACKWEYWL